MFTNLCVKSSEEGENAFLKMWDHLWNILKVLVVISLVSINIFICFDHFELKTQCQNDVLRLEAKISMVDKDLRSYLSNRDYVRFTNDINRQMWKREAPATGTANVEFIHPKLREEMDGQPEDPENPWVWLTSYSRIPLKAIQDFCAATKEYCPPGNPGSPGPPGLRGATGFKGKRGRSGRPGGKGEKGDLGPRGYQGPVGPKGESGTPGMSGLDGRDGLPGEPGLDGVPGRNGLDGIPGVDGIPGLSGNPGTPGTHGTNGQKGATGPRGPRGFRGERGLTGPRGKTGKDGLNGTPGRPGVNLYTINGKNIDLDSLLIPPVISGGAYGDEIKKIIVVEGDHLKLTCASTGIPKPLISWNRADGNAYPDGAWRKSNELGSTLNITRINRQHMGLYLCEANNGIPPSALQKFQVEVHFPPLIKVHRQVVGAYNGSFTSIDCTIEAYPTAVNYWERHDGRLVLNKKGKYEINLRELDSYTSTLTLNLTLETVEDFGAYYCISKNEKGITKAAITVFERDPNSALPPPLIGGFRPALVGEEPPPLSSFEDICPPSPKCPTCEIQRCEGAAKMYGLTVLPYKDGLQGLPNRTEECIIETIGKPVFHRYSGDLYGSWIVDALDAEGEDGKKLWVTLSKHNRILFEFSNKTMYRKNVPTKNYTLPYAFSGNNHVMYNGSLFYYNHDYESIIRYELATRIPTRLKVPRNRLSEQWVGPLLANMYSAHHPNNYLDFAIDENGLWGVFGMEMDNNTVVFKLDPMTMDFQYMWNISLNHNQIADTFIICGVLYAVDHVDQRDTRIRFALDLYKNKLLEIELDFTNPFSFTTMLNYNPKIQSLITWDGGNQLTYPIKYHAIGYKEEIVMQEANSTGFEILKTDKGNGLDFVELVDDY